MNRRILTSLLAASLLSGGVLAACTAPTPTAVPFPVVTATSPVLPTATLPVATSEPVPTVQAQALPQTYTSYQHRSGVFSLMLPDGWEVIDSSSDQRLLVRLLPPVGFGSRVTIEAANKGPLTPEQMLQTAESTIQFLYGQNPAYTEVTRSTLPDGRLQVITLYDDGRGGAGRETLYVQQSGSYYATLRIFAADRDSFYLNEPLTTIATTLALNAQAVWGSPVAAINPAELLFVNTSLWRGRDGTTYYMGELSNASPADIDNVEMRVAFCNPAGVILSEVTAALDVRRVSRGRSAPFVVMGEDLPRDVTVCLQQASARPTPPDPRSTDGLSVRSETTTNARRQLVIRGAIVNTTLARVNNIDLVIGVYNNSDQIIGYTTVPLGLAVQLDPGQEYPFEVTFAELGGTPDRYTALAQARIVPAASPSLAPTPAP